jgi:uncharacterized membrane protein
LKEKIVPQDKARLLLWLEITIYTVVFSTITVTRYFAFQTYAYDLGVYNQAIHSTLFDGRLLYSTADLTANPSGILFGLHFSPILLAVLPFYAIYPGPPTLLVIQSFVLSLGAVPMYFLGTRKLGGEKWGLFFSTLYLLSPVVQGINWYDFHPEAFLPAFFLLSLYFFDSRKTTKYLFFLVLTLMTIEFASILFVFASIYFLIGLKPWKKAQIDLLKIKLALFTILLSGIWFFFSLQAIHVFNSTVAPMSGDIYWRNIGASSLLDVPLQAIAHPSLIVKAISFETVPKLTYCFVLLGSVAFLPLLEPLIIVCVLPWLSIVLLSNYAPFYSFGLQYTAFIIPFVFYAGVLGMKRLRPHLNQSVSRKKIYAFLAAAFSMAVAIAFLSTPLNSAPLQSYTAISYGLPQVTQHDQILMKLVDLIPRNASVLTQNNVFPPLSNRVEAYVFPSSVRYPPGTSFDEALIELLDKVDFIIGDMKTDLIVLPTILAYTRAHGNFGVYAAADDAMVLKRNYSDPPVFFQPTAEIFNYKSLTLFGGTVVSDEDSKSGSVLLHSPANNSSTLFWGGPYVFFPPGRYEAVFRMKADSFPNGPIVDLNVSYFAYTMRIESSGTNSTGYHLSFSMEAEKTKNIIAYRSLDASEFPIQGKYFEFSVNFIANSFGAYEFTGTTPLGNSDTFLDEIRITQIEPSPNLDIQISQVFPLG